MSDQIELLAAEERVGLINGANPINSNCTVW